MKVPHVAFDLRCLFGSNGRRGIGVFSLGLARALRDAGLRVTFLAPPEQIGSERATEFMLPFAPCSEETLTKLASDGPVVFHVASLYEFPISSPVIPAFVTDLNIPVTATLYDAIPYAEPSRYQSTPELEQFYAQRAMLLGSCDHLLAISDYAALSTCDLLGVSPKRVTTVGIGVGARFVPLTTSDPRSTTTVFSATKFGITKPYTICVAGNDPRKNVVGLTRAWRELTPEIRSHYQLVIVGEIEERHQVEWREGLGFELIFTGEVSEDDLIGLLQSASLSVFPSLAEGFGLPIAEAAACGVPSICSNRSSMPEILDLSLATFDPTDAADIARVITSSLTNGEVRGHLLVAGQVAAKRWTWDRVVAQASAVWSSLAIRSSDRTELDTSEHMHRQKRPPRRARLALIGPFGGSPSGIGTYNERLLPELDRLADVTCFVEQFSGEAPLGTDGRRYPVGALGGHLDRSAFDHLVYTLGNSPFHFASTRLLNQFPGHVWLHEAQLSELHLGMAHLLKDPIWAKEFLEGAITRDCGPDMVANLCRELGYEAMLHVDRYHELNVRLLTDVSRHALTMIVSSDVAEDILRVDPPGFAGEILTLPLAFPPASVKTQRPESPATHDIAVLGWVSAQKGLEQAVRVLQELRRSTNARLVFIGKAHDGSIETIESALSAAGLPRDAVEVTGFLPDDALRERVVNCRAGLRLASRTDGEMSAAVTDLVALGVPTVTNLVTMGDSSPGLRVVPDASDEDLVAALLPLLMDHRVHRLASDDANERAAAWGFPEVAERLVDWLIAPRPLSPRKPNST